MILTSRDTNIFDLEKPETYHLNITSILVKSFDIYFGCKKAISFQSLTGEEKSSNSRKPFYIHFKLLLLHSYAFCLP